MNKLILILVLTAIDNMFCCECCRCCRKRHASGPLNKRKSVGNNNLFHINPVDIDPSKKTLLRKSEEGKHKIVGKPKIEKLVEEKKGVKDMKIVPTKHEDKKIVKTTSTEEKIPLLYKSKRVKSTTDIPKLDKPEMKLGLTPIVESLEHTVDKSKKETKIEKITATIGDKTNEEVIEKPEEEVKEEKPKEEVKEEKPEEEKPKEEEKFEEEEVVEVEEEKEEKEETNKEKSENDLEVTIGQAPENNEQDEEKEQEEEEEIEIEEEEKEKEVESEEKEKGKVEKEEVQEIRQGIGNNEQGEENNDDNVEEEELEIEVEDGEGKKEEKEKTNTEKPENDVEENKEQVPGNEDVNNDDNVEEVEVEEEEKNVFNEYSIKVGELGKTIAPMHKNEICDLITDAYKNNVICYNLSNDDYNSFVEGNYDFVGGRFKSEDYNNEYVAILIICGGGKWLFLVLCEPLLNDAYTVGVFKDIVKSAIIFFAKDINNSHMYSGLFRGLKKLQSVDFKTGSIEIEYMSYMFCDCKSLSKLDMSCINLDKVKGLSYMFKGCENLTEVQFPYEIENDSLKEVEGMFENCVCLKKVNLSGFKSANHVASMANMFSYCLSLEELDLSSFKISNLKNIDFMFFECGSLKTLKLPSGFFNNISSIGSGFNGCVNLSFVHLPSESTILERVLDHCRDGHLFKYNEKNKVYELV